MVCYNSSFLTIFFPVVYNAVQACWYVLSPTRRETSYSNRRFWCSYILCIIITGGILVLFIYTRLASIKIFPPSNKLHREVGRAKDLPKPRYKVSYWTLHIHVELSPECGKQEKKHIMECDIILYFIPCWGVSLVQMHPVSSKANLSYMQPWQLQLPYQHQPATTS